MTAVGHSPPCRLLAGAAAMPQTTTKPATCRYVEKGRYCCKSQRIDPGQFFQRRVCGFQIQTRGVSSSPSDPIERVLNRSVAVNNVNRRCRSNFGRFATTLHLELFQQNRPQADVLRCGKKRRYSITSSARSKIDVGTSMPSVWAVFRLTTSSILVASSTGRSAALAPLRTLPVYMPAWRYTSTSSVP